MFQGVYVLGGICPRGYICPSGVFDLVGKCTRAEVCLGGGSHSVQGGGGGSGGYRPCP